MSDFTYFDQFKDYTANLSKYFNDINNGSSYKYTFTNKQTANTILKDIFDKIEISPEFKKNLLQFERYVIGDGESIETVAYEYYGNVNHWWLICIFNDIKNTFTDWPLSDKELNALVDYYYENEGKYSKSTYYKLLFERNENKRSILVLKSFYFNDVVSAFRTEYEKTNQ
jgi:hypothetical protein